MKKILRIDTNGFFIEDILVKESDIIPDDCIDIECSDGFYKPKWNGLEWVEGLTQIEIDAIKNIPHVKTELELLREQADTNKGALNFLVMNSF